jgi:hypothetical protein
MHNVNVITKQLIAANLTDKVVGLQPLHAGNYKFEAERDIAHEAVMNELNGLLAIAEDQLRKAQKALGKAKTDEAKSKAELSVKQWTDEVAARKAIKEAAEWVTDPITDAKFVPELVRYAHNALIGALNRKGGNTKPLFDPAESEETGCYETDDGGEDVGPSKPMTVEEGIHWVAVVDRIFEHYGNIDSLSWLFSIEKKGLRRDADGNKVLNEHGQPIVDITYERVCLPWRAAFQRELENTNEDKNPNWYVSLQYARQEGALDIRIPHMDIDEAKEEFNKWLNEVPWSRDMDPRSRRERIVARVADRKWKAFIRAVSSGINKDIERSLKDWVIMSYSALAARHVAEFKKSSEYKMILAQRENEELVRENEKVELELAQQRNQMVRSSLQMAQMQLSLQAMEMQKQMAAMQAEMAKQMAAMQAKMPKPTEQPAAPAPTEQPAETPKVNGMKPATAYTQGMRPVGIRSH